MIHVWAIALVSLFLAFLPDFAQSATSWTVMPSPVALVASPNQADFTQAFTVKNTGTTTLSVTWRNDANFIKSVTPTSVSSLAPGASSIFTVLVSVRTPWFCPCPVPEGSYAGQVVATAGGTNKSVPITLAIGSVPGKVSGLQAAVIDIANPVVVQWKPNVEPDLAGYKVYWGVQPRVYQSPFIVALPHAPMATINNLPAHATYYFGVSAYDTSGNESGYSVEVKKIIP